KNFTNALNRKRPIEAMRDDRRKSVTSTKLPKCLTTLDLTSLGVGSCGGTGMYVVSGMVAHEIAGPGVVFSFIIAGLVSLLSGMCYAEFGVRVPKTSGSAYTYSYVTIGEFTAFFIGWNLVLEYLIGTASGASAISSMIDSLSNQTIGHWMVLHIGKLPSIGESGHDNPNSYPDFIALFIVLVMTAVIAAGVRNSVIFNNALNVVNILVWLFIIIAGICFADVENWRKYGGFFPHGWSGVLRGAATCFYAYIGFDIIATTGDECKEPHKSIPRAIIYSLAVCMTCYVTVSAILTLVLPYTLIHEESPLLDMFNHVGFWQAKYIISVGAFASLVVSLLGSLFPMPRVLYTMASDGLVFRFLGNVMKYTETPVIATVISGSIAAILALAVSLRDLIEMMSIGTLLAYTLVCLSVLLLRYQPVVLVDSRTNGCRLRLFSFTRINTSFFILFLLTFAMHDIFANPDVLNLYSLYSIIIVTSCDCLVKCTNNDSYWNVETMESAAEILDSRDNANLISKDNTEKYKSAGHNYGTINDESKSDLDDQQKILAETWRRIQLALYPPLQHIKYTLDGWMIPIRMCLGIPPKSERPTDETGKRAIRRICFLAFYLICFNVFLVFGAKHLIYKAWWAMLLLSFFIIILLVLILLVCQQPQNPTRLAYMAPCLPFLPICAIWFNTYLMLKLSAITWIRFIVWCFVGLFIYFGYGVWNSDLERNDEKFKETTYEEGMNVDY
uniref:Cationic amino acid transporter C-terminal domain-containing protein n=1 Tax=Ciona savignyi TaxID=51511 RepID=H2Y701_CIOSA